MLGHSVFVSMMWVQGCIDLNSSLEKAAVGEFGELLKEGMIGAEIDGWFVKDGVDPEEVADLFIA